MSKYHDTRKQCADMLHKRLQAGPSLGNEEMEQQVRDWLHTWLLGDAIRLVPELKGRRRFPLKGEPGHVPGSP